MHKIIKYKIILVALLLFALVGCDSLFDEGDTEGVYEGPPQVALFPLQREVSSGAGSTWIQVQLIGSQRGSDLAVNFSVAGTSTAVAGTHFNLGTSSPITIAANTSTVNIPINLIAGSVETGQVQLNLQLDGTNAGDVIVAENLKQSRVFIRP